MYLKSKLNDRNLCKISTEDIVLSKVGKRCVFFFFFIVSNMARGLKLCGIETETLVFPLHTSQILWWKTLQYQNSLITFYIIEFSVNRNDILCQ